MKRVVENDFHKRVLTKADRYVRPNWFKPKTRALDLVKTLELDEVKSRLFRWI